MTRHFDLFAGVAANRIVPQDKDYRHRYCGNDLAVQTTTRRCQCRSYWPSKSRAGSFFGLPAPLRCRSITTIRTSGAREQRMNRSDVHCYVVGCAVDCHAMNFQPFGVFVQALRNTSLRLRGWPLISASIAARPVTSAVSPVRRTFASLQAAFLYFVFPERREASHVSLVSVSPEEWV